MDLGYTNYLSNFCNAKENAINQKRNGEKENRSFIIPAL